MCEDARCIRGGRDTLGRMDTTNITSNKATNVVYVIASILIIIGFVAYYMMR
jgi:hypothetical protein